MIRPARPDDLDAAYEVATAWAAEVYEEASRPLFEAAWRRAGDSRLVLERDGAVVGFAVLRAGGDVTVRGRPTACSPDRVYAVFERPTHA